MCKNPKPIWDNWAKIVSTCVQLKRAIFDTVQFRGTLNLGKNLKNQSQFFAELALQLSNAPQTEIGEITQNSWFTKLNKLIHQSIIKDRELQK